MDNLDMSRAVRIPEKTSVRDLQKSLSSQLKNTCSSGTLERIFKPGATIRADSSKNSKRADETAEKFQRINPKHVTVENTMYPKQFLGECTVVSVRDKSISLLRQYSKNELDSCTYSHCRTCIYPQCKFEYSCEVQPCLNGCNMLFHKCKQIDHNDLCGNVIIPCVYKASGCDAEIPRKDLNSHLDGCPVRKQVSAVPKHNKQKVTKKSTTDMKAKLPSKKKKHDHCDVCYSGKCKEAQYCAVIACRNTGCCAKLHCCKQDDHDIVCQYKEVACINQPYGCRYVMSRLHLPRHLQKCGSMDWAFLLTYQHSYMYKTKRLVHHCDFCFSSSCKENEGGNCAIVMCERGCGQTFHNCKSEEHRELCPHSVVPCINKQHGCQMILTRCMMTTHLLHCTKMEVNAGQGKVETVKEDVTTANADENEYLELVGNDSDEHTYVEPNYARKKRKYIKNARKTCCVM